MTTHKPVRRGLIAARADATNASQILADLQHAFHEFQAEQTAAIADLRKNQTDVVRTDKVERINAAVTELQGAIDEINRAIAAGVLGGNGGNVETPEQRAYAQAFDQWFRRGSTEAEAKLIVRAAATTGSDPDGGYLVPDQMEPTIDRVLESMSPMRGLARVQPISTAAYEKLVGTSGATGGWVGEGEARTETNRPALSLLRFPAMELYANPAASQRLLDDASVDVGGWLGDEVAMEFAEMEGQAFITGTGVDEPRGIVSGYTPVANASYAWGSPGFIVTGHATAFAADPNGPDAFFDTIYALRRGYRQNARWLMNDATLGKIRKFQDSNGAYMWQPSLQLGEPSSFAGYPVESDDFMPDTGANNFPIAFGDWQRAYVIVDRIGIRVLRDPYTNKPHVHFYTTKRVGGGVQNFQAYKLMKCST